MTIEALKKRLAELQESAEDIQAKADTEKRDLTDEEQKQLETIFADFEKTEADIKRRERLALNAAALNASAGRRTDPEAADRSEDDPDSNPRIQARAVLRQPDQGGRIWVPPSNQHERDRWGWRTMGEFANSVRTASRPGGAVDTRLVNAPSTYGSEGVGTDGGFAVPPEFRTAIMKKVLSEESLLPRCDQLETSGNSITVPKDETTPWGTAGIQAYWGGEAAQYTQKKSALQQSTIKLNKLTCLVPVTDELLEDAPAMGSYINTKAPEVIFYKVNDAILNGNGTSQPLGILSAPCTVTVAAEGSQAADTVKAQNIVKMWSRMPASWRQDAIWLVHSDVEPQLMQMGFQVTDVTGANPTGAIPLYVPPGGLSGAPYATLLGRPVVVTQAAQQLGDVGDITFASLKQYAAVQKTAGLKSDSSIHLFFDYGMTAFRFTLRLGGEPWWSSTFSAGKGSTTYGPFVNLAAR